jgi:hypothetical protein
LKHAQNKATDPMKAMGYQGDTLDGIGWARDAQLKKLDHLETGPERAAIDRRPDHCHFASRAGAVHNGRAGGGGT